MRSRSTAILWALFLGGAGAHHFYLGNNKRAFLYLFFCWTGIPVVVSFLEVITWAFNDEKIFHEKHNKNKAETNNLIHLEKLFDLKQKGVITEEEFQERKKKIAI